VNEVRVVGFVLLAFGVPGAVWPYRMARLGERVDAVGSRRSWSEVEPSDWNVSLTRAVGVCCTVVGLLWVVGPAL
jgi:hypothetical protein